MQVAVLPNTAPTVLKALPERSLLGRPLPSSGEYMRTKKELLGCFSLMRNDLNQATFVQYALFMSTWNACILSCLAVITLL